jgi:hypothetical protein
MYRYTPRHVRLPFKSIPAWTRRTSSVSGEIGANASILSKEKAKVQQRSAKGRVSSQSLGRRGMDVVRSLGEPAKRIRH